MRATESVKFDTIAATTAAFTLTGGVYVFSAVATWGGGNAVIQEQLQDGTSYAPTHTALMVDGITPPLYLPPGSYRLAITTATALVGNITRVPFE